MSDVYEELAKIVKNTIERQNEKEKFEKTKKRYENEIRWLNAEIEKIPANKHKHIKCLQYQIKHRELELTFLLQEVKC